MRAGGAGVCIVIGDAKMAQDLTSEVRSVWSLLKVFGEVQTPNELQIVTERLKSIKTPVSEWWREGSLEIAFSNVLCKVIELGRYEIIQVLLGYMEDYGFEQFVKWHREFLQEHDDKDAIAMHQKFTSAKKSHEVVLDFFSKNNKCMNFVEYAILCMEYASSELVNNPETLAFICKRIKETPQAVETYFFHFQTPQRIAKMCNYLKIKFQKSEYHWRNPLRQYLYLLVSNKSLPQKFYDDMGLVSLVVKVGDKLLLEKMLENGASPNVPNKMHITPMLSAVNMGRNDLALVLLAKGADPDSPNKYAVTPRTRAQQKGNKEFLAVLEEKLTSSPSSYQKL